MATVFKESLCNSQERIRASASTTRICRNFDFDVLRLGQYCDFIKAMEKCLYDFYSGEGACYLSQDFPILGHPDDQYEVFSSMTSPSDQLRSYGVSFFLPLFFTDQ